MELTFKDKICFSMLGIWLVDLITTIYFIHRGWVLEGNPVTKFFLDAGFPGIMLMIVLRSIEIYLIVEFISYLKKRRIKYGKKPMTSEDERLLIWLVWTVWFVIEIAVIVYNFWLVTTL